MEKNLIKIIAGKKLKRKILNKAKFSNKLGELLLEPLNKFKIKGKEENIDPILFSNEKIAININFSPEVEILNEMLQNILFKFDLYITIPKKLKKKIKKAYFLEKINNANILENMDKIVNYDYIINIENEESLLIFKRGFIEACLSLLHKSSDFIYIGKETDKKKIEQDIYYQFIVLSEQEQTATLENCIYDNSRIDCSIFSTKIITENRLKKIKKIDTTLAQYNQIIYKYLKSISNNIVLFKDGFEYENKKTSSYFEISYNDLLNKLLKYETITFDIFDTLVTRTVLVPEDIFNLIEKNCKIKLPEKFITIRKMAEQEAINTLKKDVSLDEIYNAMKKMNILKEKDVETLKKIEIEYELKHIIPRHDMIKIYNELLSNNKKIDIISDMYLPKEVIIKILKKCKINNYRNLYISNELNKRKDNGMLWDMYYENNKENTIHIGDNYNSDFIQVLKRNRDAIKILSGQERFAKSSIINEKDINVRVELAILYNKIIFNSPFIKIEEIENNLQLYGEKLLSPIFYTFFDWFNKENKIKHILFVAREGYYLKPIYEKYCSIFKKKKLENTYFLTSRRAISIASCENLKDLLKIAKIEYIGRLDKFFENRYGVIIPNLGEEQILLPKDYEKVEKIIIDNKNIILENAAKEREEYLNYITTNCKTLKDNQYGIIDLGYAGTTQYYLSKLLKVKIDGYYFAITNKKLPKKLGCNLQGCFNVGDNGKVNEENNFYKKSLYLEFFLSAPEGQLICFENNKPQFRDAQFNKSRKKYLDLIYTGIIDGLEFYEIEKIKPFSIETMNNHYNFICEILSDSQGELAKILYIDDYYCRGGNEIVNLTTLL